MPAATDPMKAAQAMNMGDMGYTERAIGANLDVPHTTIHDILARHGRWGDVEVDPLFIQLRAEQNKTLEACARAAAAESWDKAFDSKKLEKASYYQLVVGGSILLDKARVLAGEPSNITANLNINAHIGLDSLSEKLSQALLTKHHSKSTSLVDNSEGNGA